MEKRFITLSIRELERLRVISKVMGRAMTQMEASAILGISDRQIRNLIVKIREKGDKGIAHGNRGREAPNKMAKAQEVRIAEIIKEAYPDFRPTLAAEKLRESHGIRLGREKLLVRINDNLSLEKGDSPFFPDVESAPQADHLRNCPYTRVSLFFAKKKAQCYHRASYLSL